MPSTYVFIEGHYYHLLMKNFYERPFPRFNLFDFAIALAHEQGLWCEKAFYYTAPPYLSPAPTQKEKDMRADYDWNMEALRRKKEITVREGRCQKHTNHDTGNYEYHEKGVDALIIMDLYKAVKATKNVIVVSSDTDLEPILREVRDNGKLNTILYYYTDGKRDSLFSIPHELIAAASWSALVTKGHFERSMKKEQVQEITA